MRTGYRQMIWVAIRGKSSHTSLFYHTFTHVQFSSVARRVRTEAKDLLELVLIPGLAAILPWGLCYRVFRYISRYPFLYAESCAQDYAYARAHGWCRDLTLWRRHRRLVMMVDHADYYLARTRGHRWMARHMDVSGTWPAPGPAILCSFHWGCGMWALWHLGAAGLRPHPLVATLKREMFPGRWLRYHYYRLRNDAVRDALGQTPLDSGANLRPVLRALRAGEPVIALLDVPPTQVAASQAIPFLGQRALMPTGLIRLAADQGLPITLYVNGFRLVDGHRFLRIARIDTDADLATLTTRVFGVLEDLIREEPVLWHYWEVAELFFQAPEHA